MWLKNAPGFVSPWNEYERDIGVLFERDATDFEIFRTYDCHLEVDCEISGYVSQQKTMVEPYKGIHDINVAIGTIENHKLVPYLLEIVISLAKACLSKITVCARRLETVCGTKLLDDKSPLSVTEQCRPNKHHR